MLLLFRRKLLVWTRIAGPSLVHACKEEKQYKQHPVHSHKSTHVNQAFNHETETNTNNILQKRENLNFPYRDRC